MRKTPIRSIHKKWIFVFSFWIVLLSGMLSNFIGSPGVIQAVRLNNLLFAKQAQLLSSEQELKKLQAEAALLETNHFAQIREIRRVLGYAAPDEIIFDLTHLE
jgi:hypothetical protein